MNPAKTTSPDQTSCIQLQTPQTLVPSPNALATSSEKATTTSTPQIPHNQSTSKSGHGSILNRFKIQFENVVHLKPNTKSDCNTESTLAASQTSDLTDLTEENQKTVTKKDGLALLKQCLKEQEKIEKESSEESSSNRPVEEKSPSEIASKLNDLYCKHLEEETKEQSKFIKEMCDWK